MKVFIVGRDSHIEQMYIKRRFEVVEKQEDADIIQFIGGFDIDPEMYGEHKLSRTMCNLADDIRDKAAWRASTPKQMKIGICRGGQILNVLNGGWMWQHVDNHADYRGHEMEDALFGRKINVTSTHHQMMIPAKEGAELLGFARGLSANHKTGNTERAPHNGIDPEVIWYERTNTLCFQPHPEYSHATSELTDYFFDAVELLRP